MWLNELFTEATINFEKRCRVRIVVSIGLAVLGLLSLALVALTKGTVPVVHLDEGTADFVSGFYTGIGFGLVAAGSITIIQNVRYLKKADLKKQRQIYETDERNRMLGMRCWAYSGYAMFLILYVGMLVSGLFNVIIMKTLLAVMAVYGVLLLVFKEVLKRCM